MSSSICIIASFQCEQPFLLFFLFIVHVLFIFHFFFCFVFLFLFQSFTVSLQSRQVDMYNGFRCRLTVQSKKRKRPYLFGPCSIWTEGYGGLCYTLHLHASIAPYIYILLRIIHISTYGLLRSVSYLVFCYFCSFVI